MSFHPGRISKAYLNTGTYAIPTWTELTLLGDLSISMTRNSATVVTRDSPNQKTVPGSLVFEVSGTYYERLTADTVLDALKVSFFADSTETTDAVLDMCFTNEAIATSGATGVRGPFFVTDLSRSEGADDAVSRSVTFVEVDGDDGAGGYVDAEEYTTA